MVAAGLRRDLGVVGDPDHPARPVPFGNGSTKNRKAASTRRPAVIATARCRCRVQDRGGDNELHRLEQRPAGSRSPRSRPPAARR